MKRTYMSGAQKRKLAAEKKDKDDKLKKKMPKINTLFGASTSTSTIDSIDSTSSSSAITNEEENINEKIETESETNLLAMNENVDETSEYMENVSDSSAAHENIIETLETENELIEFPTDAGLWDITNDVISLQNYWIKNGKWRMRLK